jgi:hypothetical protein
LAGQNQIFRASDYYYFELIFEKGFFCQAFRTSYFAPLFEKPYEFMNIQHFVKVAEELNIKVKQVTDTIELLDEGATVPFISRYRKGGYR